MGASAITLTAPRERTLVATVHLAPDNDGRIYQDWRIQIVTPHRVLDLPLDSQGQARWWQYHYVRTLIENGVPDAEILAAIRAIQQVDTENAIEDDLAAAEQRMRAWCAKRGLNYDEVSEEQITELANEAITAWRQKQQSA
jgi:hypothetical protein